MANATQQQKSGQIQFITAARGVAIFLVVLGHTIVPEMRANSQALHFIWDTIYEFHMPLFFMLSGYLFQHSLSKYEQKPASNFIKSKFLSLIIPYISFSLISYVLLNLAFGVPLFGAILQKAGYETTTLLESVISILTLTNHIDKHIWFVYALFMIFLISYPLRKILYHKLAIIPLLLLLVLVGYGHIQTIDLVQRTVRFLFFFTAARHLGAIDRFTDKKYLPILLALFVLTFALDLNLGGGEPNEWYMWCSAGLLKAVAGLSGSLLVLGFCRLITAPVLNRPLNFLSRHSYSIYLIHQPFLVSGIAGVLLMITPLPFAVICAITLLSGIFIPVFLSTTVIGKIPFARAALLGEFRK